MNTNDQSKHPLPDELSDIAASLDRLAQADREAMPADLADRIAAAHKPGVLPFDQQATRTRSSIKGFGTIAAAAAAIVIIASAWFALRPTTPPPTEIALDEDSAYEDYTLVAALFEDDWTTGFEEIESGAESIAASLDNIWGDFGSTEWGVGAELESDSQALNGSTGDAS